MATRARSSSWLNHGVGRFTIGATVANGPLLLAVLLRSVAFLIVFISLCSCDANLFGRESRAIAGGYHLKRADNPNQFVLTIPNESGGLIIDEIGWRKPLIVARASGSQYWDVINTAHAQHTRVNDLQLRADPIYQSIQTKPAETAWKELNGHKRLW